MTTPLQAYLVKQERLLAIQARQRELDDIESREPLGLPALSSALRDEIDSLSEEEDNLLDQMDRLWVLLDPVERRRAVDAANS